jgi:hypothetical protein
MRPLLAVVLAAAGSAFAQAPPPLPPLDVEAPDAGAAAEQPSTPSDPTILGLLLKKNILTPSEYESAAAGLPPPEEGRSPLMGKWAASMYGFLELDGVGDSTQSFFEQMANNAVARPETPAGNSARFTAGARNSRLGLKLTAPPWHHIRATGIVEIDFLGNALTPSTDSVVFTGAGPRFRHLAILIESPIVDVLVGQWWHLFGWQPNFFSNTVEIQGELAEVYGRGPQLRLSHLFRSVHTTVELAAAAELPVQRDVLQPPDLHLGVRLAINNWKGWRTSGQTGSRTDPMMFGVSGMMRRFTVPGILSLPGLGSPSVSTYGWGVSLDALVPIIRGNAESRANALTFTASVMLSAGLQDQLSALSSGVSFPMGFKTDLANGLVGFGSDGTLHAVEWASARAALQYYLPPSGNVWVSLDAARLSSTNVTALGSKSFRLAWLGSVNLFVNVVPSVRVGAAYELMWQQYTDGQVARNHRVLVSAFYLF